MFKKVFEYAGEYKKLTILSLVVIIFGVFMSIVPFFISYQIIVQLIKGDNVPMSYFIAKVIWILICLLLHACLYVKGLELSHNSAYNILMKIRVGLQKRMEKLPLGIIQEKGIGSIKRLFVDDIESIELLLAHAIPEGIGNIVIPIFVYVSMFFIDWKLALMSLASLPIGIFAMSMMMVIGKRDMENYYVAGKKMNNTIIKYVNGMEVLKVFNKDGELYGTYKEDIKDYRDFTLRWYKACWPWMAIYNSILPCTTIVTLPLGAWFVLKGYSSLDNLVLILCLSLSLGIPLLKALGFLPSLTQINYKITELEKVLSAEPLKENKKVFIGNNHNVDFNNVEFAYEDKIVINNVNLRIKEGEKTALVGESGSGKSTLAKLLVHYYDVNKGSITIGGQDIRDMSLESLNKQIAYVSQEQFLFNISLLENIRIGKLDASVEEVLEAAEKAQCMEFINKLPNGIMTMAGQAGKQLSGGQLQRITIARAILKNAPIVILDEATAFTDPENEEKLEAAINEVVKGKTLIVIAHRLATIKNADKICVMSDGEILSIGKHQELLENCNEYKRLWKAAMDSAQWKVSN